MESPASPARPGSIRGLTPWHHSSFPAVPRMRQERRSRIVGVPGGWCSADISRQVQRPRGQISPPWTAGNDSRNRSPSRAGPARGPGWQPAIRES